MKALHIVKLMAHNQKCCNKKEVDTRDTTLQKCTLQKNSHNDFNCSIIWRNTQLGQSKKNLILGT